MQNGVIQIPVLASIMKYSMPRPYWISDILSTKPDGFNLTSDLWSTRPN